MKRNPRILVKTARLDLSRMAEGEVTVRLRAWKKVRIKSMDTNKKE
jgi:hypothetical protein